MLLSDRRWIAERCTLDQVDEYEVYDTKKDTAKYYIREHKSLYGDEHTLRSIRKYIGFIKYQYFAKLTTKLTIHSSDFAKVSCVAIYVAFCVSI